MGVRRLFVSSRRIFRTLGRASRLSASASPSRQLSTFCAPRSSGVHPRFCDTSSVTNFSYRRWVCIRWDSNLCHQDGYSFSSFRKSHGATGSSDDGTAASRELPKERVDCVVIGAGVVGLAIARELGKQGREVVVLEAADAIGTGTSSRNSEVIHAGIYYPAGSLKAKLCVAGKHALYTYCNEREIPHQNVGKLIVATGEDQFPVLDKLLALGIANGVEDLRMLGAKKAMEMEPSLRCMKALFSPSTGIVDSHAFMLALQTDAEGMGVTLALNSTVARGSVSSDGIELVVAETPSRELSGNEQMILSAKVVVNAAGLYAQSVARRMKGLPANSVPKSYYARGCYFYLSGFSGPPFNHLIYPVPEEGGIGVHVTMDLGGQTKFGPDVEWLPDLEDNELFPGRFDYYVDPRRSDQFYSEVRRYFPALPDGALQPAYAGIRPKLFGKGQLPADFLIQGRRVHGIPGLIQLYGIESPGLTSALGIAQFVGDLVFKEGYG